MTFADYPILIDTYVTAVQTAIEESKEHPDHFIYLFRFGSGYRIDYSGIPDVCLNDTDRHISTYSNGERTL